MFKRLIASFICFTFSLSNLQYVQAQDFSVNQLPVPGTMIEESAPFAPLALKGLVVNPQKPLEFQFIVDTGRGPQDTASIKDQANQLVKYFLAGLTIPEGDLWVNLSPYEKDRMVPQVLGQTDLGRDLLAQDYILKQLTASLIYPEKGLGKEFWSRVYAKAQQQFGTTNVPVNTFNKVWILPDQAQVYENVNAAYVTKSTLKVMLDEDYTALEKHSATMPLNLRNVTHSIGANIVRQIILPEIEKEVNTGKNFAPLRQIYQALILAKWYKQTIQNGLLDAVYTNKNKVAGVNLDDPTVKEQIYQRYLAAYKKGAFNYIKEDVSLPLDGAGKGGVAVPRKYFSGGARFLINVKPDGAMSAVKRIGSLLLLIVALSTTPNRVLAQSNTPQSREDMYHSVGLTSLLVPWNSEMSLDTLATEVAVREVEREIKSHPGLFTAGRSKEDKAMLGEILQLVSNHPYLTALGAGSAIGLLSHLNLNLRKIVATFGIMIAGGIPIITTMVYLLMLSRSGPSSYFYSLPMLFGIPAATLALLPNFDVFDNIPQGPSITRSDLNPPMRNAVFDDRQEVFLQSKQGQELIRQVRERVNTRTGVTLGADHDTLMNKALSFALHGYDFVVTTLHSTDTDGYYEAKEGWVQDPHGSVGMYVGIDRGEKLPNPPILQPQKSKQEPAMMAALRKFTDLNTHLDNLRRNLEYSIEKRQTKYLPSNINTTLGELRRSIDSSRSILGDKFHSRLIASLKSICDDFGLTMPSPAMKVVLHEGDTIDIDFEGTIVNKFANTIIYDRLVREGKEDLAKRFLDDLKAASRKFTQAVDQGVATVYDVTAFYKVFAGIFTQQDFEDMANSYQLNEKFLETLRLIKEKTHLKQLKLRIVGRGIQQPFEIFLAKPHIRKALSDMGYEISEIKANRLEMVDGVATGNIEGAPVIDKNTFHPPLWLFLGDERDLVYNFRSFIMVNGTDLKKAVDDMVETSQEAIARLDQANNYHHIEAGPNRIALSTDSETLARIRSDMRQHRLSEDYLRTESLEGAGISLHFEPSSGAIPNIFSDFIKILVNNANSAKLEPPDSKEEPAMMTYTAEQGVEVVEGIDNLARSVAKRIFDSIDKHSGGRYRNLMVGAANPGTFVNNLKAQWPTDIDPAFNFTYEELFAAPFELDLDQSFRDNERRIRDRIAVMVEAKPSPSFLPVIVSKPIPVDKMQSLGGFMRAIINGSPSWAKLPHGLQVLFIVSGENFDALIKNCELHGPEESQFFYELVGAHRRYRQAEPAMMAALRKFTDLNTHLDNLRRNLEYSIEKRLPKYLPSNINTTLRELRRSIDSSRSILGDKFHSRLIASLKSICDDFGLTMPSPAMTAVGLVTRQTINRFFRDHQSLYTVQEVTSDENGMAAIDGYNITLDIEEDLVFPAVIAATLQMAIARQREPDSLMNFSDAMRDDLANRLVQAYKEHAKRTKGSGEEEQSPAMIAQMKIRFWRGRNNVEKISTMLGHKKEIVRQRARQALADLAKDPKSLYRVGHAVLGSLCATNDKKWAINMLVQSNQPDAIEPIGEALRTYNLRDDAFSALKKLAIDSDSKYRAGIAVLKSYEDITWRMPSTKDVAHYAKWAIIKLEESGRKEAIKPIGEVLKDDEVREEVLHALRSLATDPDSKYQAGLLVLKSWDDGNRIWAFKILAESGRKEAIALIMPFLHYTINIAREACRALETLATDADSQYRVGIGGIGDFHDHMRIWSMGMLEKSGLHRKATIALITKKIKFEWIQDSDSVRVGRETLARLEASPAMLEPSKPSQDPAMFSGIKLRSAASRGDVDAVAQLLAKGANVGGLDLSGNTALMLAAKFGHEHVVKLLLAQGNIKEQRGLSAWVMAGSYHHKQVIATLYANQEIRLEVDRTVEEERRASAARELRDRQEQNGSYEHQVESHLGTEEGLRWLVAQGSKVVPELLDYVRVNFGLPSEMGPGQELPPAEDTLWSIRALGEIRDARSTPSLLRVFRTSGDPILRRTLAEAFAKIGGADVIRELLNALNIHKPYVLQALEKIGEPAIGGLLNASKRRNPDVKRAADEVLKKLGVDPHSAKSEALAEAWALADSEPSKPAQEPAMLGLNNSQAGAASFTLGKRLLVYYGPQEEIDKVESKHPSIEGSYVYHDTDKFRSFMILVPVDADSDEPYFRLMPFQFGHDQVGVRHLSGVAEIPIPIPEIMLEHEPLTNSTAAIAVEESIQVAVAEKLTISIKKEYISKSRKNGKVEVIVKDKGFATTLKLNLPEKDTGEETVIKIINRALRKCKGGELSSDDLMSALSDYPSASPAMLKPLAQHDKAALVENGGIDLNRINVKRNGRTVNVRFDPAQLAQLTQGGFQGFTFKIESMTPISSPFQLLGIKISK